MPIRILSTSVNSIIDNRKGLGAVPHNQDVDYFGLRVHMTPSTFRHLAAPLAQRKDESIKFMVEHLKAGGTIGSPFLLIEDRGLDEPAKVVGHEGRHRMLAVAQLFGDNAAVEVHLFWPHYRRRHLTPEMIEHWNKELCPEKMDRVYRPGPYFKVIG
jgi:hypothetical protein